MTGLLALAATLLLAAPPFVDLDLDAARARAADEERLLVVVATATWSGPARRMEVTTWRDEGVRRLLDEHAITVALDIDAHPGVARALSIEAMPTVIVFRGGAEIEFDRRRGYLDPEAMATWLGDVVRGERWTDRLRRRLADAETHGAMEVRQRLELARALLDAGAARPSERAALLAEAAERFLWLWHHIARHEPALAGVRVSFMARDIERLIALHPPARAAFAAVRDGHRAAIDANTADREAAIDWTRLNEILGEDDATLAWGRAAAGRTPRPAALDHLAPLLFVRFVHAERWADAWRLHADPVGDLQRRLDADRAAERLLRRRSAGRGAVAGSAPPRLDPAALEEIIDAQRRAVCGDAALLYAAALAADDEAAAAEIAERLTRAHDGALPRVALVEAALRAAQPRLEHRAWLAAARTRGLPVTDITAALDAALAARAASSTASPAAPAGVPDGSP